MPGIDGLETLQRIKERVPDACVLMVTAFASIELAVDAMRLGATDFLRKPMTPEMLRGAVAAAIAGEPRPSARRSAASSTPGRARIETLTLNGFQILRSPELPPPSSLEHTSREARRRCVEFTVTVAIDTEAVERVARLTHRRLEPGGAFWRVQPNALSGYVWSEGKGPADGGSSCTTCRERISISPHGGKTVDEEQTMTLAEMLLLVAARPACTGCCARFSGGLSVS